MSINSKDSHQTLDAIIVGAGFSGLYQLHSLRNKLNLSARVFEAGGGIGGTWYWNRYPGARCDTESHSYCYSFDADMVREWEWSEKYPAPDEIRRYLNWVAERYDLKKDIQFDSNYWRGLFVVSQCTRHCRTRYFYGRLVSHGTMAA